MTFVVLVSCCEKSSRFAGREQERELDVNDERKPQSHQTPDSRPRRHRLSPIGLALLPPSIHRGLQGDQASPSPAVSYLVPLSDSRHIVIHEALLLTPADTVRHATRRAGGLNAVPNRIHKISSLIPWIVPHPSQTDQGDPKERINFKEYYDISHVRESIPLFNCYEVMTTLTGTLPSSSPSFA